MIDNSRFFYFSFIKVKESPSVLSLLSFYHEWMLHFVKLFFYTYGKDHISFLFQAVDIVNSHIFHNVYFKSLSGTMMWILTTGPFFSIRHFLELMIYGTYWEMLIYKMCNMDIILSKCLQLLMRSNQDNVDKAFSLVPRT